MKNVSPEGVKDWLKHGKPFLLVDVRENFEREAFHIGGEHIPVGELFERKNEIPKEGDVVLYCEKGIRSAIAIQRLEALGYHNLINLSGGMSAWRTAEKS